MKIEFFGDSITDASRDRGSMDGGNAMGVGFVRQIAGILLAEAPEKYEIINRGISGNRIVDLYARIKADCWNLQPDVLSILIGVNDVWHEINYQNGVDIERFEKVYDMLLEDTQKQLPNTKIILCGPFVLLGCATEEKYEDFLIIREYAKVVQRLAEKYGLPFLPLQEKFDKAANVHDAKYYLIDGVHPNIAGATLIANEWIKLFKNEVEK